MKRDRLEVLEREHADFFERWHAERMKREKLERALIEARRWIGDGDCSDGLSREYWTHAFADVVALVDAALKTPNVEHNRRPQGVRVDGPVGPLAEGGK